jgi:glutamate racemase
MKNKTFILPTAVSLLFLIACGKAPAPPEQKVEKFGIVSQIKFDKKSPFYIDFEKYPGIQSAERKVLPVGVFDSGTGGLTVLSSILDLDQFNNKTREPGSDGIPDFEAERFVYLGDSANMPYGRYDGEGKSDFLRELIIKDVQFLLSRNYYTEPSQNVAQTSKDPAKAIVIACNTATAFGFDTIKKTIKQWNVNIEVLGIIDAGARAAVSKLPGEGEGKGKIIGIMATEGTCASGGYPRSVKEQYADRFHDKDIAVVQQAGFGLAAAIDGDIDYIDSRAVAVRDKKAYRGPALDHPAYPIEPALWKAYNFDTGNALLIRKNDKGEMVDVQLNSVGNYIKYHVTRLVDTAVKTHPDRQIGAAILGCTHYPFYEKEIKAHFDYLKTVNENYNRIIPNTLTLIDPSRSLAKELYQYLANKELLRPESKDSKPNGFYISVPNPLLKTNRTGENGEFLYSYKYGRQINSGLEFVKRVPFSPRWIKQEVLDRIRDKMPKIYDMFMKR